MVVGARQSFQFFRQITWFLENNRALSKFLHGTLHHLISMTKLCKKALHKTQFYFKDVSHLEYCPEIFHLKIASATRSYDI